MSSPLTPSPDRDSRAAVCPVCDGKGVAPRTARLERLGRPLKCMACDGTGCEEEHPDRYTTCDENDPWFLLDLMTADRNNWQADAQRKEALVREWENHTAQRIDRHRLALEVAATALAAALSESWPVNDDAPEKRCHDQARRMADVTIQAYSDALNPPGRCAR